MIKLVLVRHGESLWNKENKFTGWTDVDLSEKGIDEAISAGKALKENGFTFDLAFTSVLKRAISTLWIILREMDLMWIPEVKSWKLNERHYGALQGLNKAETAAAYGEEQVLLWRRSYELQPPALTESDPRHPRHQAIYRGMLPRQLPATESLKDVSARFLPFWENTIFPALKDGKKIIIVAHGNTLRALVKHLDQLAEAEVINLNIPTGIPLIYEFDNSFRPFRHYYLGDQQFIKQAIDSVANQSKKADNQ